MTTEYGQRVRFKTILTTALLDYNPIIKEKICLGKKCGLCLLNCSDVGVLRVKPEIDEKFIWLNPVSITDTELYKNTSKKSYCKGRCISSCLKEKEHKQITFYR